MVGVVKVEEDKKRKAAERRVGRVAEVHSQTKACLVRRLKRRSRTTLEEDRDGCRVGASVASGQSSKRRRGRSCDAARTGGGCASGRRDGEESAGTCMVAATAACQRAAGRADVLGMNMQKRAAGPGWVGGDGWPREPRRR